MDSWNSPHLQWISTSPKGEFFSLVMNTRKVCWKHNFCAFIIRLPWVYQAIRVFMARPLCVHQTVRAFMIRLSCVHQTICAFLFRLSCVHDQTFVRSSDYWFVHDQTFVRSSDISCVHFQTFGRFSVFPDFVSLNARHPVVRLSGSIATFCLAPQHGYLSLFWREGSPIKY